MAKKRKKAQPVVMRQKESNTIKIKIDPLKVATGHRPHTTGSGAHLDTRQRRRRTRSAALRQAIADQRG